MTYQLINRHDGTRGIKCLNCNLTSWNRNDVDQKYCGNCHIFHEDQVRREVVSQPRRHGKASGYADRMMTASNKKR